jgi:hypothetical protein
VDLDAQAWNIGQAFLEEQRAGAELVHARRMAGLAGDEDQLLLPIGGGGTGWRRAPDSHQQAQNDDESDISHMRTFGE